MPWYPVGFILFLCWSVLINTGAVVLSYHAPIKQSFWYWPATVTLGILLFGSWFIFTARATPTRVYITAAWWDTLQVVVCVLLPAFLFGIQLDRWSILGITLMLAGLILLSSRLGG